VSEPGASSEDRSSKQRASSEHPWRDAWQDMAPHLDLGWRLASAVAVPPLLGWGVDYALTTAPWGMLVGTVFGLVSAAYILVTLYSSAQPPTDQSADKN
jgi:F0F1-type ATP synthase assembly protein I